MKKILAICIATYLISLTSVSKAQNPYHFSSNVGSFNEDYTTYALFPPFYSYPGVSAMFASFIPQSGYTNPVSILRFDARKLRSGIQLQWSVGTEDNVARYEIQKGKDEAELTTIGSLVATGRNSYSYRDNSPSGAVVYYRIKSVDWDGQYKYSSTICATNGEPFSMLIAYPMPALGEVTLQHQLATSKGAITVHTEDGSLLQKVTPAPGTTQTTVDLSYIKSGRYLLRFDNGEGKAETLKIVKQ